MRKKSPTRRRVLGTIGAGVVSSPVIGTVSATEHTVEMTFEDQQVRGVGNSNGNQRVVIDHVYMPEPGGWIDLHHSDRNDDHETAYRAENGEIYHAPIGRPFGVSEFLEGGTDHYDVEIPLFVDDHVLCLDTEQDRMEESHWLMAMAHEDQTRMPGDDGDERQYIHFCWMQADEREEWDRDDFGGNDGSFNWNEDDKPDAYIEVPPDGRGNPSEAGENNRR